MYKSYFKIGWRNLLKDKGYSAINIGGLAISMIVVMLAGLWVYDEMTFNRYHKNYEQIAQVVTHVSIGGETVTYYSLPMPTAEELRVNYASDFEAVAATVVGDRIISYEEKVFTKRGCFSDFVFPEMVYWHIIGVVHDMVMSSPFGEAMPTVFMIDNRERPFNLINIRLSPDQSAAASLIEVEKIFKKLVPNTPFEYRFADQEYASKFTAEQNVGDLVFIFTMLAIIISCRGLLGLASFVSEQRTKEIGIRKVLGASAAQVWQLISFEFVVLVIVAGVLAIPLSAYLMSSWLLQYDYRMELSWHLFAAAIGVAIVITLITVSYHAFNAARMNPVDSLRTE